jgi:hypothetical protein
VTGQPYVNRISAVGNQLVVTVTLQGTATDHRPAKQVALIGTPRG